MMVLNRCVSVPFVNKLHSMRMHCYVIYINWHNTLALLTRLMFYKNRLIIPSIVKSKATVIRNTWLILEQGIELGKSRFLFIKSIAIN